VTLLAEDIPERKRVVVFDEQGVDSVLHPDDIRDQPGPMPEEFFKFATLNGWNIDRGDHIGPQELGQHMTVQSVVLDLGRRNAHPAPQDSPK